MRHLATALCLALGFTSLAACSSGSKEPAVPTSPASSSSGDKPAAAAPTVWSEAMSHQEKGAFMKTRVLPAMKKVFQDHDATKYANFSCKSCHGEPFHGDPRQALPHLTMRDGELTAFAEHAEVAKWMATAVSPTMAKTLDVAPYDPKTHQGFGCGNCHMIDKK